MSAQEIVYRILIFLPQGTSLQSFSPIPRESFFAFSLVLVCPLLNLPGQLMSKPLCVKLGKAEVRLNVQEPGAVVMSQSVGKRGSASSWKLTKS